MFRGCIRLAGGRTTTVYRTICAALNNNIKCHRGAHRTNIDVSMRRFSTKPKPDDRKYKRIKEQVQKSSDYYAQYDFVEHAKQEEEDYRLLDESDFDSTDIRATEETFPISLERPTDSLDVIPVPDLVTMLRAENARDIVVIEVPPEASYCHYLVLASVLSSRHMYALQERIRKVYNRRRDRRRKDPECFTGAKRHDQSGWITLDMSRIILHLMLRETREHFDLEQLWGVGAEFDEKTNDSRQELSAMQMTPNERDLFEQWMREMQQPSPR